MRYHYLWARQADAGEESGRKARPVCLVVRTPTAPANLYLFPLTSQQPDAGRAALAISEIECRRAGLDGPTWLIVDEYNFVSADRTYDLESDKLIGAFSAALLRRIATLIKRTAAERRIRAVRCT